jgi:hypothetical protein
VTDRPLPCEEARALLDEGFDRALAPAEAEALRAHLDGCASCRDEAAAAERVHRALASMVPPDPGPAFADRVVGALDRAPGGSPDGVPGDLAARGSRLLRGLVAVAGTAAVAALAIAVLPLDAAAATVGDLLPRVPAPALPAIPVAAADMVAGLPGLLPPWAAALGALAAAAAAAVPVAALRRGPPGDCRAALGQPDPGEGRRP